MSPLQVPGEHAGRQAEVGVVGPVDDLAFQFELQHGHHRSEDLLPHDRHVVGAAIEDGRLDEVPVRQGDVGRDAAAAEQPRAVRPTVSM